MNNLEENMIREGVVILPERIFKDVVDVKLITEIIQRLSEVSKHVILIAGSILVSDSGQLYNRSYVFQRGKLLGYQDKLVPFSRERSRISPGRVIKIFELNGFSFAVAICYDIDFPFFAKISAINGANVIFNPSLIRHDFHKEWHQYIKSRSLENRMSVVSVNSNGSPFKGDSIFVSPYEESDAIRIEVEEFRNMDNFQSTLFKHDVSGKFEQRVSEDPGIYSFPIKKIIN